MRSIRLEPLVSAFHLALEVESGNGANITTVFRGNLKPVSSKYFCTTLVAAFTTLASLNGQLPLITNSKSIPPILFGPLRKNRPTQNTARSGSGTEQMFIWSGMTYE